MAGFTLARLIVVAMLIGSLAPFPYGYYTLLRILVTGVGAYGAYAASRRDTPLWTWLLGGIAVLFNPAFPVRFDRPTWAVLDVLTACVFVATFASKAVQKDVG